MNTQIILSNAIFFDYLLIASEASSVKTNQRALDLDHSDCTLPGMHPIKLSLASMIIPALRCESGQRPPLHLLDIIGRTLPWHVSGVLTECTKTILGSRRTALE
jgi:hypothetical protein